MLLPVEDGGGGESEQSIRLEAKYTERMAQFKYADSMMGEKGSCEVTLK